MLSIHVFYLDYALNGIYNVSPPYILAATCSSGNKRN